MSHIWDIKIKVFLRDSKSVRPAGRNPFTFGGLDLVSDLQSKADGGGPEGSIAPLERQEGPKTGTMRDRYGQYGLLDAENGHLDLDRYLKEPWLDEAGDSLPPDKLKKVSAKWDPIQWELYLESLEGNLKEKMGVKLDVQQRAELFASRGDEEFQKNAEQDLAAHAWEAEQTHYLKPIVLSGEEKAYREIVEASDEDEKASAAVRYAIEFLTVNERFVVQKYFWDGKSEPAIAKMMKKSRPTVHTWKSRGLTKICELLSPVLPISGGTPVTKPILIASEPRRRGRPPRKLSLLSSIPPVRNFPFRP